MMGSLEVCERLVLAATAVRRALEQPCNSAPSFPHGWCQGASKLLAKYLVEVQGIDPVEGVANGRRYFPKPEDPAWPIEHSHFWLEHAGFIVDITADQFDYCSESVIVTKDRTWHDRFIGQTRLPQELVLDLNDYLLKRYALVLKHIREAS